MKNIVINNNPNMQPTEVTVADNVYRIRKMDAFASASLLKFMTSKGIPLLAAAQGVFDPSMLENKEGADGPSEGELTALAAQMIPPVLDAVSDEELKSLMIRCLNYCDKKLPAGYQPVMDGETFGIAEAEGDVFLCLVLCFHAIAYNMKGFFDGSGLNLKQLMSGALSRLKPPTSTNTSLPQ